MTKEELYKIQDNDSGQTVAEGLHSNFEGILDTITDTIGDINTVLDTINGEEV